MDREEQARPSRITHNLSMVTEQKRREPAGNVREKAS